MEELQAMYETKKTEAQAQQERDFRERQEEQVPTDCRQRVLEALF